MYTLYENKFSIHFCSFFTSFDYDAAAAAAVVVVLFVTRMMTLIGGCLAGISLNVR